MKTRVGCLLGSWLSSYPYHQKVELDLILASLKTFITVLTSILGEHIAIYILLALHMSHQVHQEGADSCVGIWLLLPYQIFENLVGKSTNERESKIRGQGMV